jgi:PKHD-type hydroxylase
MEIKLNANHLLLKSVAIRNTNDSVTMIATAKNFLSREECQQILSQSERAAFSDGFVDNREKSTIRDSKVIFLSPNTDNMWIFEKLDAAITHMNKAYQYDLLGFYEGIQVARYTSGGKYDWHIDLGSGDKSTRKSSMSIQLSDPNDYEGANLEFANIDQTTEKAIGTLIVFPSFLQHRVTPATQGTRLSLVAWIHGQPFR